MIISHKRTKPASAPTAVVAMSSPDPTIEPAMISPGPNCLIIPRMVLGGLRHSSGSLDIFIKINNVLHALGRQS